MKLEWKKEELIHNTGRFWWVCGICCQGSSDREAITHSKSCPFSDDTVKGFHLTVFPTHDTEICGRCGAEWSDCPAMTVCDGWDQVTLLSLCNRYAEGWNDRQAVRSRLREALASRGKTTLAKYAAEQDNTAVVESIVAANESRKTLICTGCEFSRGPELTCACGRPNKPCQRGSK